MIIDFHSHILPEMDDGAKSVDESVKILELLAHQGVDTVVATPHFYLKRETPEVFLKRREKSFQKLLKAIDKEHMPKIVLGAEVAFTPSLEDYDLSGLYIQNTDYMMLEMPYQNLSRSLLRTVDNLIISKGFLPIIAHVERYLKFSTMESIKRLAELDVVCQVNADSLAKISTRKKTFDIIKESRACIIGSDAHNLSDRSPKMDKAVKVLKHHFSEFEFNQMMNNANEILKNIDIIETINMSTD